MPTKSSDILQQADATIITLHLYTVNSFRANLFINMASIYIGASYKKIYRIELDKIDLRF